MGKESSTFAESRAQGSAVRAAQIERAREAAQARAVSPASISSNERNPWFSDPRFAAAFGVIAIPLLLSLSSCSSGEPVPTPTPEPTKTPIERCFSPSSSLNEHLAPLISLKQDGDLITIGPNAVLMGRIIAVLERPDQESLLIGVNTGKKGVAWVEVPRTGNDQFGLNPPNINAWDQRRVTGWTQVGSGAEALQQVLSQSAGREVNIIIPLEFSEQQLRGLGGIQRQAAQQALTMNNLALGQTIRQVISANSSPQVCTFVPTEFSVITYKITPPVPSR